MPVLQSLLLLFVAIAGPWVVHLAPRRQRLMALVGFIGVLLLWLVFASWVSKWWFWIGLLIGIVTVVIFGDRRGRPRSSGRRPPSGRGRGGSSELTEEIAPEPRR